ncbi:hypothetical protein VPH35_035183 [Triticum aestivum]
MAVADAVLPSPPPPARIVVVVLALVRFALAPMLALGRVLCVAAGALPYLWFAAAWGSAPFLFLQAFTSGAYKVCAYSFLVLLALAALLLCGLCVAYAIAVLSGSGSAFNKRAGAIAWESAANHSFRLPRAAVLGLITDVPFFLLLVAGLLLAMMSHAEGSISQGEMVGLLIADVGIFGMHAISCILIIPALALSVWREDQADRTAPSQSC